MPEHIELTDDQLTAIKKRLRKDLPEDEEELLEALVRMAENHPEKGGHKTVLAWHYMIPR
jgi:predicted RNA polymerase sigma factor